MIATISVTVASDLNGFDNFSWMTTTYLLGSAISQSMSGHITDMIGRRKGLVISHTLFALGTLSCGLSSHLPLFLTGRVLQGLGGGAVSSITAFVETDLIPTQRRGFIEGLNNIFYGIMMALGGFYGAGVNHLIGWKWAFLLQVPVIALDGVVVFSVVKVSDDKRIKDPVRHPDWIGIATLIGSLVFFQIAFNNGSITLRWSAASVVIPIILAAATFAMFVYWELSRAKNPVMPLRNSPDEAWDLSSSQHSYQQGRTPVACFTYLSIWKRSAFRP